MVRIKTKVGPKGQIVIPKVFRDEYNISPGDDVIIVENDQTLLIEKPQEDFVKKLEDFAKKVKLRKFNIHAIEEEYEEKVEEISTFYLDSNVLINAAGNDGVIGDGARRIMLAITNFKIHASTSCLTIDELLWVLRKTNKEYMEICGAFLNSNIRFLDTNKSIISISLDLIREFNLKPRDAIHVATMKFHNIKNLISEDSDFDRINWIKRKKINEFKII